MPEMRKGRRSFSRMDYHNVHPDFVLFGSALPKWTGGFLNAFNYKGVNCLCLLIINLATNVFSGTNFNAIRHGLHKMTLEGRDRIRCSEMGSTQMVTTNTVKADVQTYWEHLRIATNG